MNSIGILGAGPAGLSAALWLKNLGFAPWIADPEMRSGGMQNLNFLQNDWVLGQRDVTGPQLTERFVDHVRSLDIPVLGGCQPERIVRTSIGFSVTLVGSEGGRHQTECASLLLATGTRFRGAEVLAGVSGLETLPAGHVIYGPYAFADLDACRGQRLLIVGGGDNAFENARLLRDSAQSIDLVLRSPPRAQQALRDAVAGAVRVHQPGSVAALVPAGKAVCATLNAGGRTLDIEIDRIHVLAGYEPNTTFLASVFPEAAFCLDRYGYLETDAAGRTGVAGVYAAGDICNPAFPSVVAALAQGARAAKTIELDLRRT